MKKLVYSLFAMLLALAAYAQPNPDDLFISGYVTEQNSGQAMNGAQVCVVADSTNSPNFNFYQCVTTNSNGYYSVTIPNGSLTGPNISFYVYTWDCNNSIIDTIVVNAQGSIDSHTNVDFQVCQNNTTTCQADFVYNHGFNGGVFFTYTGTPNNPSSYFWDFGDGTTSTQQDPSHYYNGNGPWVAQLTITTSGGCTSTVMDTVWDSSGLCQASFTYNTFPSGVVAFSYNGTNQNNQTYQWSFGDGSSSNSPNPTHTYTSSGPYSVCVTITDTTNNCTSTYCDSVVFGNTSSCQANFSVSVDSSLSGLYLITLTDQSVGNVLSYDWWVDGASYSTQNVTHTYQGQGIIGVCLTIQTADSCTSYLCDTLYLGTGNGNGNNCQASFQYSGNPSGDFQFYGSSGVNSAFYYWDFGDGTTSTQQNPTHTYNGNGTYTVCLTVSDSANQCSSTYCDSVSVGSGNSGGCQAYFQAYPDSSSLPPFTSNVVYFSDLSSGNPSYWSWDFGDNTTSNQQHPIHTYNNPGTYTVCLTIANLGSNCFDTYCTTVTIDTNSTGGCQAYFNSSLSLNGQINFYGYSGQNSAQYVWSFGDGSSGSGQNVTHSYNAPGTYTACLTVYGSSGCTDTYCAQVSYGTNTSGYCISGTVSAGTPNYPADYGLVYLITYNSQTNELTAVDTTTIDSSGFYSFCNVSAGQYLIKAALTPNSVYYSNYLPTYYGNSLFWDYGQYVQVGPNLTYPYAPITLIAGNNPGGPGFVGGDVTQGANKTSGPGDPIESVLVMLLDLNDDPVAYTYTNAQGQFQFADLAYGTYKVHAEVPGLPTYPAIVTVDADNESYSNIHIYQNTSEVTTGVIEYGNDREVRISEIYPNPTNGQAFITFELMEATDVTINVFGSTGQLVSSQTVQLGASSNQVEIATDNLNQGLYFVQFTEVNGQFSFNKQMVVNK